MSASQREHFWLDHTNLSALYRWLVDNDKLDTTSVTDVAYFLSKPWKWQPEWEEMHGRAAGEAAAHA